MLDSHYGKDKVGMQCIRESWWFCTLRASKSTLKNSRRNKSDIDGCSHSDTGNLVIILQPQCYALITFHNNKEKNTLINFQLTLCLLYGDPAIIFNEGRRVLVFSQDTLTSNSVEENLCGNGYLSAVHMHLCFWNFYGASGALSQ